MTNEEFNEKMIELEKIKVKIDIEKFKYENGIMDKNALDNKLHFLLNKMAMI